MPSVNEHFVGKTGEVKAIYDRLVALTEAFGQVEQDPKKTSIHLNRQTAFAGVAVRKAHIVLTRSNSVQSRIWTRNSKVGSKLHTN
jgi:hypothetical protein